MRKLRKAFSMIELIFIIVIIGILAGVAIPRLATNSDTATVVKAKSTLAAVRSSILIERNKRILSGNFNCYY